jgi:hypothetical protein
MLPERLRLSAARPPAPAGAAAWLLALALVAGCAINPLPTPGGDGGGLIGRDVYSPGFDTGGSGGGGADAGPPLADAPQAPDAGPPPEDAVAPHDTAPGDVTPPPDVPAPDDTAGPDVSLPPLVVPFVPTPPAEPWRDAPFRQETNHTTNTVEPGLGPLVAVVWPPAAWDGWDRPTQVTPRGLVRHDAGGALGLVSIPEEDPGLLAALVAGDTVVLAGPRHVYRVTADGAVAAWPAPGDVTVRGLAPFAADMVLVLGAPRAGFLEPDAAPEWLEVPFISGTQPLTATTGAEGAGHVFVGATDGRVVGLRTEPLEPVCRWEVHAGVGAVRALVPAVSLPEPLDLIVVGDEGIRGVRVTGACPEPTAEVVHHPLFAADRVPLDTPRAAAATSDGGFVVATAGGAYRLVDRGPDPRTGDPALLEWRVYNQERWLPSEDVRGLLVEPDRADGRLWFATAGGLATVTAATVTLEEKLGPFVDRIVQRHDRDGAVADSHLPRRGDLASNIPWDSDNDGSWTSYWLVAECFRWKVTGDPAAKEHFDRSLDAMLRLRDLTGTDHFVARALIRKEGCLLDDCDDPDDGEWFTSADGEWWVKADTSNDEVIAHIFMMGPAHDLCADEDQKLRIRDHIAGIVGGIVDHGYQLVDLDGEVTTYGQFDPVYVNEHPAGRFGDGGVRSASILAGLTLAQYLTGDARFDAAKRYLIEEHHYDENTRREAEYPIRFGNSDGDEMATYAFFVLLHYETDPALRDVWLDGWRRQYAPLQKHQAAWWDAVNAVVGEPPALDFALRWLRLAPVDMIRWDVHNSHRHDLRIPDGYFDVNSGVRSDGLILPYDERRCDRWNTDQFRVDGGMGAVIEMDGADVLAPYWMLRYFGFVAPAE